MMKLVLVAIYAFLLVAPMIVLYYSVSPTVVLQVPASELTLQWYANLLDQPRLVRGIVMSTLVASLSTFLALLAGIPAALSLTRGRFRGRDLLSAFFLSPLVLPGLVLALGILMVISA